VALVLVELLLASRTHGCRVGAQRINCTGSSLRTVVAAPRLAPTLAEHRSVGRAALQMAGGSHTWLEGGWPAHHRTRLSWRPRELTHTSAGTALETSLAAVAILLIPALPVEPTICWHIGNKNIATTQGAQVV